MRVFYDCEFIELGAHQPVVLVSLGMVREDGAELYRVNANLSARDQEHLRSHPWLSRNVWPHLPHEPTPLFPAMERVDRAHPSCATPARIREEVDAFLADGLEPGPRAELWAWYGSYDHVVLSQLFGTMAQLPPHVPMYTRDLKQAVDMFGLERVDTTATEADGGEHNALADARALARAWADARAEVIERTRWDWLGQSTRAA